VHATARAFVLLASPRESPFLDGRKVTFRGRASPQEGKSPRRMPGSVSTYTTTWSHMVSNVQRWRIHRTKMLSRNGAQASKRKVQPEKPYIGRFILKDPGFKRAQPPSQVPLTSACSRASGMGLPKSMAAVLLLVHLLLGLTLAQIPMAPPPPTTFL